MSLKKKKKSGMATGIVEAIESGVI